MASGLSAWIERYSCAISVLVGKDVPVSSANWLARRKSFCMCLTIKPGSKSPARIFGPRVSSAHDLPAPFFTASKNVCMSRPDFFASTKASAMPARVATPINWLAIFVV